MITAPSNEPVRGSLTYEPYYGLREKPFSLSSDPRFLYTGPAHVHAFEQLLAGIRRREGVIVLSGEIGTGKTTLCRGVLEALDRRTFSTFVRDPFLSREDLLKTLLIDFGVMSIEDLKNGRLTGASRPDLSYPLYEFLDSLVPLQAFAVLIIDEAQNLSASLLEEVRILSDLEAREKLLQVVLVGQPELRANLKLPELRQVDQRVSVRCELGPLPAEEVALYIAHRLGVASVGAPAVEFTPEAARLVARASGGVPRVINLICDRALHRGFVARAVNIDAATVFGAVEDLGRGKEDGPPPVTPVEPLPARPPAAGFPVEDTPASAPTSMPGRVARTGEAAPDPLAEFSHEADLAGPGRRWSGPVAAAAIAAFIVSAGAGLWLAYSRDAAPHGPAGSAVAHAPRSAATQEHAREPVHAVEQPPVSPAVPESPPVSGNVPPVAASLAGRPAFAIQVASFQSPVRAQRALDELRAAGYAVQGTEVDLGPRGVWIQVLVGGYATAAEAEANLPVVRARGAYADARVVPIND